ncbi:MAG: diacylglycerol kinase family protein [Gemmatimonadales bacterium]
MARVLLISNPVAGRHDAEVADTVRRTFAAAGWQVDWRQTVGPRDANRFAADAVGAGVDVVAVLGGDGTTMQVAAALAGTNVTLGLLPGGTGNVLAGNLRIPPAPVPAAELILRGRSRVIDLGRIERDDGPHYFGVACGAGADARVMGGTDSEEKKRLGIGGYFNALFRVIPTIRSAWFKITVDGDVLEGRASLAMVLNCGEMIPPLVRVRREAVPDDGLFDVLAIAADTPWEVARGFWRALTNVFLDTGETAYLRYARGREVTIETDPVEPVQYDGDLAGTTPVTAVIQPHVLRVMAPEP